MGIFEEFEQSRSSALDALPNSNNESIAFPSSLGVNPAIEKHVFANINLPDFKPRVTLVIIHPLRSFESSIKIPQNPKSILVYAKVSEDFFNSIKDKIFVGVKKLSLSGITYNDIVSFEGISIGEDVFNYGIQERTIKRGVNVENVSLIIDKVIDWLEVPSQKRKEDSLILQRFFYEFVLKFQQVFIPESSFERMRDFLLMMLDYAVTDLKNLAAVIAEDILKGLAKEMKSWKLEDEKYWNPNVEGYSPIIPSITATQDAIFNQFQGRKLEAQNKVKTSINGFSFENATFDNNIVKEALINGLFLGIDGVTNILGTMFNEIKEAFLEFLDVHLKLVNSFIVGLYNGTIDVLANILEETAEILLLLDRENFVQLVEGLDKFFKEADFQQIKDIITQELKSLFNFIDGEGVYKNVLDLGGFVPKIIKIVIEFFFIIKGALTLIKNVPAAARRAIKLGQDIAENIPDLVKKFNERVQFLKELIRKLFVFDPDTVEVLESLGIKVQLPRVPINSLGFFGNLQDIDKIVDAIRRNAEISLDGGVTTIKVNARQINELVTARKKGKQDKVIEILSELDKRSRGKFRKNSKNFKKFEKRFLSEKKKYGIGDKLDFKAIQKDWYNSLKIVKKEMSETLASELSGVRKSLRKLNEANIAKARMEIQFNGETVLDNSYIEHSGAGAKLKGSKGNPNGTNLTEPDTFDLEHNTNRANDSEVKLTQLFDEDIARLADQLNVDVNDLDINIRIETTYDPCNICKKQILLRQQIYGANFEVVRPFYIDDGVKRVVTGHTDFETLNL